MINAGFFEWGDEIITVKPLCKHGKPCCVQKVKKEGCNQGRSFLCCPEPREKSCKFFQWYETPSPKENEPKEPEEDHTCDEFPDWSGWGFTQPKRPMDETENSSNETQPAKKKTAFSKRFRTPPACRKGICGHFECYEQSCKGLESILQGSSLF